MAIVSEFESSCSAGEWLRERRARLDGGEASWLAVLADFDHAEAWRADGQLSCIDWLRWHLNMGRSTAFEKLSVAHALAKRPALMAAFAAGDVSYCAVRAICRIDHPTPEVEASLLELAKSGPVWQVERAVRFWLACADQDRPPDERGMARGLLIRPGSFGHMGTIEIRAENIELAEFARALDMFLATKRREASVEESTHVDEFVPWWQRRTDAFFDLVATAAAHAHEGNAVGADRYLVHVVATADHAGVHAGELLDGQPISDDALAQTLCDCSTVAHLIQDGGEPLAIGRKQHEWTAAQRRAIAVRDGGRCRFPGCERTRVDVHHMIPWTPDGRTDVDNGYLSCRRHHTMLHGGGYQVTGKPNGELAFHRADGTPLGATAPLTRTGRLFPAVQR